MSNAIGAPLDRAWRPRTTGRTLSGSASRIGPACGPRGADRSWSAGFDDLGNRGFRVRPFADGSGRPEQRIADLERQLAELRPGANKGGYLTPEQVRNVAFSKPPMGRRGYNEDEVDAFLDLIEQQVKSQQRGASLPRRQAEPPPPPALTSSPMSPLRS